MPRSLLRHVLGLAEDIMLIGSDERLLGGRLDARELADALVAVDAAEAGVADAAERQARDAGEAITELIDGHAGAQLAGDRARGLAARTPTSRARTWCRSRAARPRRASSTRWIGITGPNVSSLITFISCIDVGEHGRLDVVAADRGGATGVDLRALRDRVVEVILDDRRPARRWSSRRGDRRRRRS